MNQFVIIFVPYGEKSADIEGGQRLEPENENATISRADPYRPADDAEQLPLWRWFNF